MSDSAFFAEVYFHVPLSARSSHLGRTKFLLCFLIPNSPNHNDETSEKERREGDAIVRWMYSVQVFPLASFS